MNLTLEEQERRAYADGDTEKAALLGQAVDAEESNDDALRHENEILKAEVDDLAWQLEEAHAELSDIRPAAV